MEDEMHLPKVAPLELPGGSATKPPTTSQIWRSIVELHAAYQDRQALVDAIITVLLADVKEVKMRMSSYEKNLEETNKTLKANTAILTDINSVMTFFRKAFKIAIWPVVIIATGFLTQFSVYLYHLLFH